MKLSRLAILALASLAAGYFDQRLGLLVIVTGLTALLAMPLVIKLMNRLHILDHPNQRTSHELPVPTCGGLGVFLGMVPVLAFVVYFSRSLDMVCISLGLLALLTTGLIDDIKELAAKPKFLVQFLAAGLVVWAGVRIETLHGLFGIYELPYLAQFALSVFVIVGVTNATNLLDGIDGLAGGIGFIIAFTLGVLLFTAGEMAFAMLAFGMSGALLGFLYYNFKPAKIFMGDTGSLILGFTIIVLGIRLSNHHHLMFGEIMMDRLTIPLIGLFMLPVFDTLRIFLERMMNGNSPFLPDQNHIHHLLMKTGFDHARASQILYVAQLSLIASSVLLSFTSLSSTLLIIILFAQALIMSEILTISKLVRLAVKAKGVDRLLKMKAANNYLMVKNIKA